MAPTAFTRVRRQVAPAGCAIQAGVQQLTQALFLLAQVSREAPLARAGERGVRQVVADAAVLAGRRLTRRQRVAVVDVARVDGVLLHVDLLPAHLNLSKCFCLP